MEGKEKKRKGKEWKGQARKRRGGKETKGMASKKKRK